MAKKSISDKYTEERLSNLKLYSDQRRSHILQQYMDDDDVKMTSPHALIQRNDTAATTSTVLPASIAAVLAWIRKWRKTPAENNRYMRHLKAGYSAFSLGSKVLGVGSLINAMGSRAGEMATTPPEIVAKRIIKGNAARYFIPGMATYDKARFRNVMVDREPYDKANTLVM